MKLTQEQIDRLKKLLPYAAPDEKRRILELLDEWDSQTIQEIGKESLLSFVDHVYPGYKVGPHHKRLARIFEEIAAGKKKRVIVNIAPRDRKTHV